MSCPAGTEEEEEAPNSSQHQHQRRSTATPGPSAAAESKLQAFLSGRKGNKGIRPAAAQPSPQQLAEQQRQQQQQRLLERKLKKQFMSSKVGAAVRSGRGCFAPHLAAIAPLAKQSVVPCMFCKVHCMLWHHRQRTCCDVLCVLCGVGCVMPVMQVDKIFSSIDPQQLAADAGGAEEAMELTPEQFAAMRRDVEQLGEQGASTLCWDTSLQLVAEMHQAQLRASAGPLGGEHSKARGCSTHAADEQQPCYTP